MKTVDLDDDVYGHIAAHTKEIGESASSILRRLLGIPLGTALPKADTVRPTHELTELLAEPMFGASTTAVARMLRIFKEVHTQKQQDFEKILGIQGRNRAYFAKSKLDILRSGKSTQPREIYGTGYWVMTNSPTPQKREMVREVLRCFNYSKVSIEAAAAAIQ